MTKKQIIKLLDKDVGLFGETEDENSLGEPYLTKLEFKKATEILEELKSLQKGLQSQINFYKRKILKNEKGYYIKLPPNTILENNIFNYKGDLIFLDPKDLIISNSYFNNAKEWKK